MKIKPDMICSQCRRPLSSPASSHTPEDFTRYQLALKEEDVKRLIAEVRRLRELASCFFAGLGYLGEYLFVRNYWRYLKENPWLMERNPYPAGSAYFPESRKAILPESSEEDSRGLEVSDPCPSD